MEALARLYRWLWCRCCEGAGWVLANTAPPGCGSVTIYYEGHGRDVTFGFRGAPCWPGVLREVAGTIELEMHGLSAKPR